LLKTPYDRFQVSRQLWDHLQANTDLMTLYYLTRPVTILLSVKRIPRPIAPTDTELATVTGIGDDGELIYAEQDTPSQTRSMKR
jgi:hypothetical protein